MIAVLNPDQEYTGQLVYTNSQGGPAKVDGKPIIDGDMTEAVLVATSDDGLSLLLTPAGGAIPDGGESNFTITADADLGGGMKALPLEIKIIWSREAVGVSVIFTPVVA
jgi:hypothetical protein